MKPENMRENPLTQPSLQPRKLGGVRLGSVQIGFKKKSVGHAVKSPSDLSDSPYAPVRIYFTTFDDEDSTGDDLKILYVSTSRRGIRRHETGKPELLFRGTVPLKDFAEAERTGKWDVLRPQDVEIVDELPEQMAKCYVLFKEDFPIRLFKYVDEDRDTSEMKKEALQAFERFCEEVHPDAKLSLRKLTVPKWVLAEKDGKWALDTENQTVIKTYEPNPEVKS